MEDIIRKISNILSLILIYCVAGAIYFNYKGFEIVFPDQNSQKFEIIFHEQVAEANEHGPVTLQENMAVNVSTKYALGSSEAPLTLYEYSSLTCPHCADFHLDVMPQLVRDYVDTGLLRVIFVNFPLDRNAMKAAMLSECMTYENYFGFLNRLFDTQRSWWMDNDNDQLFRFAAEYGLGYGEAVSCISNETMAHEIVANRQEAVTRLKMQGTPAFLFSGRDGNEIFYGMVKYQELKEYLDNRLAKLGI